MKKIIAWALTVLMCVAVLTSCSFNTIEKDPEELAKIVEITDALGLMLGIELDALAGTVLPE